MKKTFLYAVVVIVVALGSYFAYGFLNTAKGPVTTEESLPQEGLPVSNLESGSEITRYGDTYIYTNSEFGFKLAFTKAWEGLNPRTLGGSEFSLKSIYMQVPVVYCNEAPDPKTGTCYASPMIVSVYSKSQWDAVSQGALKPTFIAENADYVFAYATWQDAPAGMEQLDFQIPSVIASFRFK